MKLIKTYLAATLLFVCTNASAGLIVENWIATSTTLSFDISGTIDPGVTIGPSQQSSLFIGPANLGEDPIAESVSGVLVDNGSGITFVDDLYVTLFNDSSSAKLQIRGGEDWASGHHIDLSISFDDPDLFDLSDWDPTGAIVSAGRSNYVAAPEAAYQVGVFMNGVAPEPVPAPTPLALFALGLVTLGWKNRKSA